MTIKDFQPQSYKNFNHHVHSTRVPVFNLQIIKQSKRPQRVNNFLGIEHILQQNNSDIRKIDQIINKLNRNGSLSTVNVFNTTRNDLRRSTLSHVSGIKPRIPYLDVEHQKDSKELKVQFVLDCGLKDMASSLKKPQPTLQTSNSLKKFPIQYPTYPNAVFNQRVPTKATVRPTYIKNGIVYYVPTKNSVKIVTTPKPRIKNVYVDPPIVGEISDTLENVYNYFENSLTTKVKVKPRNKQVAKKRPIKRSTVGNSITPPTTAPNYRYTHGYNNGQKLTTNIHVTSEYVGKDPVTERPSKGESASYDSGSDDSYDDDGSDDDDDDDADDYDRDEGDDSYGDDYDFSLGGGDVSVQCACLLHE